MADELEVPPASQSSTKRATERDPDYPVYAVVGNGPVGIRCAQKLLEYSGQAQVVVFGDEARAPYNRVKLSQYLADRIPLTDLDNPVHAGPDSRLTTFNDRRIATIDRNARVLIDVDGGRQPYDKLILATGSEPATPDIPGVELSNVYPFRSLRDTEALIRLRDDSRHICVVGAGALGLEAAAALKNQGNRVTLQSRGKILGGLLGDEGAEYLQSALAALGVELRIGQPLAAIEGGRCVEGIRFANGDSLAVDAVVLCTGIRPAIALAESCGLETGRGILTDEWMRTSDPHIYAAGECAEFGQRIYQFVRPGYEQAEVCCSHICRETAPAVGGVPATNRGAGPYGGSPTDIQLKIAHIPCAVIGEAAEGEQLYVYRNRFKGLYRLLRVSGQRLVGAVYIGSWDEAGRLRQAVAGRETVTARALRRFEDSGQLWEKQAAQGIKAQPDSYLVCQCNNVTKGQLCGAISLGKRSLMELQQETNAGSVCGSCRPLVAELLDAPAPNLVMRHARGILVTSVISLLLIALALLMPPAPISESVQSHWYWQKLWYDNFWKQVSGYTLLVCCLLTATLSLRKRWRRLHHGHVDHWRYVHSVIGCAALAALVVHTGFRLGENLNLVLMLDFLAATTTGALVGIFMARNHHWTDMKLREHRKWWSRIHYALLWAMPALIGYHILAVYYF